MKKTFTFLICIITCLTLLWSCNILEHEHTMSGWKYNENEHWRQPVCGRNDCIVQAEVHDLGEHVDEDENEICDVCGYKGIQYAKSITGIDGTTKIKVTRFDIGEVIGTVTLVEEISIEHIVDNLNSLKFKQLKYNEPTAIEYELAFYNADGEIIKIISIELGGWIDYHGSLHSIVDGELDLSYIEGLFTLNGPYFIGKVVEVYDGSCLLEVTDKGNWTYYIGYPVQVYTDFENCPEYSVGDYLMIIWDGLADDSYPPQIHNATITLVEDQNQDGFNDIFYAAAYPEDFEYNGRHYHLVQSNELKTSVTKEELGELLGYIIREEDISAFRQEYPTDTRTTALQADEYGDQAWVINAKQGASNYDGIMHSLQRRVRNWNRSSTICRTPPMKRFL